MLAERMWSLPSKCWVTVIGEQDDWAAVRYADGSTTSVPVGTLTPEEPQQSGRPVRPIEDLRASGLLWLINRAVLHPRGFALALVVEADDRVVGWQLLGDGTEPWSFGDEENGLFAAAEATLRAARPGGPAA